MNRLMTETNVKAERNSYRGLMVAAKRPKQTLCAVLAVQLLDPQAVGRHGHTLGSFLQYKTIIQGGIHLVEFIQISDEIAKRCKIIDIAGELLLENWLCSSMNNDKIIIDKSTFIIYANPEMFKWEMLQECEDAVATAEGRTAPNLRTIAAMPKNLTALREAMCSSAALRHCVEMFEQTFYEDMASYLDYGHLMSPDETARICKELKIDMDS